MVDEERLRPDYHLGQCFVFPLVFKHCCLDDRRGIRPIKEQIEDKKCRKLAEEDSHNLNGVKQNTTFV